MPWILYSSPPSLNDSCSSDSKAGTFVLWVYSLQSVSLFCWAYTPVECADSTVLPEWQCCESQDHVSSMMNHVTPVQANLNLFNTELCFSYCQGPSISNHVTHSRFSQGKNKIQCCLAGFTPLFPIFCPSDNTRLNKLCRTFIQFLKKQVMNKSASVIFGLVRLVISHAKTPLV